MERRLAQMVYVLRQDRKGASDTQDSQRLSREPGQSLVTQNEQQQAACPFDDLHCEDKSTNACAEDDLNRPPSLTG